MFTKKQVAKKPAKPQPKKPEKAAPPPEEKEPFVFTSILTPEAAATLETPVEAPEPAPGAPISAPGMPVMDQPVKAL